MIKSSVTSSISSEDVEASQNEALRIQSAHQRIIEV